MKAISLVFEYDFNRQLESGRTWGKEGYRSRDFIFEYSAASFITFADKNKNFNHEIFTDNPELLWKNLNRYDVDLSNIKVIDGSDKIREWKNHRYCFYPAMMHLDMYKDEKDQLIKLDNDLVCLENIEFLYDSSEYLLWQVERDLVSKGREYWGEREASRQAFGTDVFPLWNIGVLGFPKGDKKDLIEEMINAGIKCSEVDISSVCRFPEAPGLTSKIWSCAEQTGYSFVIHDRGLKVRTTKDIIDHHCHGFDSKKECILSASHLLKKEFRKG